MRVAKSPILPKVISCVVISAVVTALFLPSLNFPFLEEWDDITNFIENKEFHGWDTASLHWMWTSFHLGHYTPLAWMSFGLHVPFWGLNPAGFHLGNILLHTANALLVFGLGVQLMTLGKPGLGLRRESAVIRGAVFGALFFAVHPLRVESVAWATQRRDLLAAFFLLIATRAYVAHATHSWPGRPLAYILSLAAFALSLFSKTTGMLFGGVLLLLDVLLLNNPKPVLGSWRIGWRCVGEKTPFFLLAVFPALLAAQAQQAAGAAMHWANYPWFHRILQAAWGALFYPAKTIFPVGLSPFYDFPAAGPMEGPFLAALVLVVGFTAYVVARFRRYPGLAAAWGVFLLIFLPTSGLFQSGSQFVADRYSYVSMMGFALLFGHLISQGLMSGDHPPVHSQDPSGVPSPDPLANKEGVEGRLPFLVLGPRARPKALIGASVGLLIGLSALTLNQLEYWKSNRDFWQRVVDRQPHSGRAWYLLGLQYKKAKDDENARRCFAKSVGQIIPDDAAYALLALDELSLGRDAKALWVLDEALTRFPANYLLRYLKGVALLQLGRASDALPFLRAGVSLPDHRVAALSNLGAAYLIMANWDEAERVLDSAGRLDPLFPGLAINRKILSRARARALSPSRKNF